MRLLLVALIFLFVLLQYEFWLAPGGVMSAWKLKDRIAAEQQLDNQLRQRNEAVSADITDLKSGNNAVEEQARMELGMVKKGETFYQIVDHHDNNAAENK